MLASSKGYLLPDYLLSVCVHIIAEVSECPYRDSLSLSHSIDSTPLTAASTSTTTTTNAANAMEYNSPSRRNTAPSPIGTAPDPMDTQTALLPHKRTLRLKERDIREEAPSSSRTLVLSMMLRAAFGGLVGDVIMMNEYAFLWFNRFFRHDVKSLDAGVDASCIASVALSTSPPSSSSSSSSSVCDPSGDARAPFPSRDARAPSDLLYCVADLPFYMHGLWLDSSLNSPWGRLCLHFSSSSTPSSSSSTHQQSSTSADTSNCVGHGVTPPISAFTLLRSYIVQSMETPNMQCSLLSLFSPRKTRGSHQAQGRGSSTELSLLLSLSLNQLLLRPVDLIPEGIDFHCDGEIIHSVQQM